MTGSLDSLQGIALRAAKLDSVMRFEIINDRQRCLVDLLNQTINLTACRFLELEQKSDEPFEASPESLVSCSSSS